MKKLKNIFNKISKVSGRQGGEQGPVGGSQDDPRRPSGADAGRAQTKIQIMCADYFAGWSAVMANISDISAI